MVVVAAAAVVTSKRDCRLNPCYQVINIMFKCRFTLSSKICVYAYRILNISEPKAVQS